MFLSKRATCKEMERQQKPQENISGCFTDTPSGGRWETCSSLVLKCPGEFEGSLGGEHSPGVNA